MGQSSAHFVHSFIYRIFTEYIKNSVWMKSLFISDWSKANDSLIPSSHKLCRNHFNRIFLLKTLNAFRKSTHFCKHSHQWKRIKANESVLNISEFEWFVGKSGLRFGTQLICELTITLWNIFKYNFKDERHQILINLSNIYPISS